MLNDKRKKQTEKKAFSKFTERKQGIAIVKRAANVALKAAGKVAKETPMQRVLVPKGVKLFSIDPDKVALSVPVLNEFLNPLGFEVVQSQVDGGPATPEFLAKVILNWLDNAEPENQTKALELVLAKMQEMRHLFISQVEEEKKIVLNVLERAYQNAERLNFLLTGGLLKGSATPKGY